MSTAIVRIYTRDGFILAGDGRRTRATTGAAEGNHAQKVFPVENKGRILAYAIQGLPHIFHQQTQSTVIDIGQTVHESIKKCSEMKSRHNLDWYAHRFVELVQGNLKSVLKSHPDHRFPPTVGDDSGVILQIFMCGYYRGNADDITVQLRHENHQVSFPKIFSLLNNPIMIFGSPVVAKLLLRTSDQRFAAFRTPAIKKADALMADPSSDVWNSLTIEDGVDIATNYIRACDTDAGREVDNECCSGIGGHIHVAQVTKDGFRWIIPPKEDLPISV